MKSFLKKDFIYFEGEGKGVTKRASKTWKGNNDQLPLTRPQLGTWPATQACVLTGNRTSDLLILRPALNPQSTSQGTV